MSKNTSENGVEHDLKPSHFIVEESKEINSQQKNLASTELEEQRNVDHGNQETAAIGRAASDQ